MLIALDIGNSRLKYGVFEGETLIATDKIAIDSFQSDLQKVLDCYPDVETIIVASVKNFDVDALKPFNHKKVKVVNRKDLMPFKNLYRTPETLGIDRMVLAAGASLLFPNQNCLVIDAGTCITYDFINSQNEYLGGAISPGLQMRYKSMNAFTDKLPLLNPQSPKSVIGDNTENSMHSGAVNGIRFEIEGYRAAHATSGGNFTIILTGGDSVFLAKEFKNTIFATPNFLLESLNALHRYQTQNA